LSALDSVVCGLRTTMSQRASTAYTPPRGQRQLRRPRAKRHPSSVAALSAADPVGPLRGGDFVPLRRTL
jgi:hypothetical protein